MNPSNKPFISPLAVPSSTFPSLNADVSPPMTAPTIAPVTALFIATDSPHTNAAANEPPDSAVAIAPSVMNARPMSSFCHHVSVNGAFSL